MRVKIVVDPPKDVRPEGAIRCDVAWKLYLPESMGDLPDDDSTRLIKFNNWLWWELSSRLGYLKPNKPEDVWLLTPPLTDSAAAYLVRICSIWSGEVYVIEGTDGRMDLNRPGPNMWNPPIANVLQKEVKDPSFSKFVSEGDGHMNRFITPLLGSTKAFVRIYEIPPDGTYARMHSHTAREEMYLVLKGRGTVRYGYGSREISEGDLISKPLGPDVSTQLLADKGVQLRILDIEIWQDVTRMSKDLVHYPDHGELDLFGPGWNLMIPDRNIFPIDDAMNNYGTGYERNADGSWVPKDVPGLSRRNRDAES